MCDHRDHRVLGLFDSDPLIGAGLLFWLPAGAAVRHALEEYVREAERRAGYEHVYSPVLGERELYEISGHWAHDREDMFSPMAVGSEQMLLRPSLRPHHALIYRSRLRSHRELPLRLAGLAGPRPGRRPARQGSAEPGGHRLRRPVPAGRASGSRSPSPTAAPLAPASAPTVECPTKP